MKATALLLALALTGCAFCEKHETACAAIVAGAGTCVALSLNSRATPAHDVTTQPVNCNGGASCQ